jgi:bifunctional non-homologous end joining protein LigD
MLCLPVETLPKGDWLYEIKWDGYRAQGIVERSRSRLLSRNGTSLAADFPNIARALARLDCWRAIVDGEIVVIDETGRPDYQQLQQQKKNRTAAVRLVLFDLLHLDGEDLMDEPLEARRTLLQRLVRDAGPPLMYSGELQGSPEDLISSATALRLEGIIAKKRGSPYLPDNRQGLWMKYRMERSETKHLRHARFLRHRE